MSRFDASLQKRDENGWLYCASEGFLDTTVGTSRRLLYWC